ncbi:hypothetical protein [Streptomyces sp. NBC_00385]|uniref:hypothetical protein n=1 Tax=Streptomyces sp. NBC_00385 TaxID=2975733 RepID=UPI002DDB4265|nr:hypothetical protein [Streptomyces sp. NBC_00385]WRZ08836.1 hypothetical protein OG959_38600 [Streptomyces sp. NBC_00385]
MRSTPGTDARHGRLAKRASISAAAIGLAAGALFATAGQASAAGAWHVYASGSYPGSVHGWGTSNADCYTTWNVDDTLADGHGAGLQFWINDGSNWYVNPPVNHNGANGAVISGTANWADDAAVSVRAYLTEGGQPIPGSFGAWRNIC